MVKHNPDRALADPNQFPVLPYEKVDVHALPGPHHARHAHHLLPFQPGLPLHLLVLRRHQDLLGALAAEKAERTVETIRWLHDRYGINGIEFHDSNFFTSEKRVAAFCRGDQWTWASAGGARARSTRSCATTTTPGT